MGAEGTQLITVLTQDEESLRWPGAELWMIVAQELCAQRWGHKCRGAGPVHGDGKVSEGPRQPPAGIGCAHCCPFPEQAGEYSRLLSPPPVTQRL